MSIINNNNALNKILSMINDLPNIDDVGGSIVYTNIVYNDDNTITLTDKDGVDHIMVCEYTEGTLSSLTYDGKSIELIYEEDILVGVGATEVDMENAPCEESEEFVGIKYSDFGGAYNLPQVADARSFENRVVNKYPEFVYNFLFYNPSANANGGFHSNLKEVYLPDIKTTALGNTFSNCGALTTIHGNLETVENVNDAFSYCKVLPYAPYMPNLKRLGGSSFAYCETFTEFKFYSKASSIHTTAFTGCTNLTDIYVPWAEGAVANAPWGATNATIHYNTTYDENGNPIISEV